MTDPTAELRPRRRRRVLPWIGTALVVLIALAVLSSSALFIASYMHGADREIERIQVGLSPVPLEPTPEIVARGEYLARIANCAGCHTAPGGAPYAGGLAIRTPLGTVWTSNLTPDEDTGLGRWSTLNFRRAMHDGRSRDGRPLLPVFPYPNYTRLAAGDVDAIYAWLRTLPPVRQATPAAALPFPVGTRAAMVLWRLLYFSPGRYTPVPERSAAWNRGAYLIQGATHCSACHGRRDGLYGNGGPEDLRGGAMPTSGWYAPSLLHPSAGGLSGWSAEDAAALLRDGHTARGAALGPMAEVVLGSTQHLAADDLAAMVEVLRSLPVLPSTLVEPERAPLADTDPRHARGAKLYRDVCADCHGREGEGDGGTRPALAGNRAVSLEPPDNVVRMVLGGGFAPSTAGNPRPYGMPPFATQLSDDEIADVVSYVRASWGHHASAVNSKDVNALRAAP